MVCPYVLGTGRGGVSATHLLFSGLLYPNPYPYPYPYPYLTPWAPSVASTHQQCLHLRHLFLDHPFGAVSELHTFCHSEGENRVLCKWQKWAKRRKHSMGAGSGIIAGRAWGKYNLLGTGYSIGHRYHRISSRCEGTVKG